MMGRISLAPPPQTAPDRGSGTAIAEIGIRSVRPTGNPEAEDRLQARGQGGASQLSGNKGPGLARIIFVEQNNLSSFYIILHKITLSSGTWKEYVTVNPISHFCTCEAYMYNVRYPYRCKENL